MAHVQAIVILAVLGGAICLPQRYVIVPIISRSYESDPSGAYRSSFQTGDGASVQETGYLIPTDDGQGQVIAKSGSYSYTSPEGLPVSISYVADQFGFKPVGNVLPVAPKALPPTF